MTVVKPFRHTIRTTNMGMPIDKAEQVAEAIAYWLVYQPEDILYNPDTLSQAIAEFLTTCDDL